MISPNRKSNNKEEQIFNRTQNLVFAISLTNNRLNFQKRNQPEHLHKHESKT